MDMQEDSKARNRAIAERVLVTVDNVDGQNVLVALAPDGVTELDAQEMARKLSVDNDEVSDLMQALSEAGFVVFEKFVTVDLA
ncbi:hypothetical protein F6X40_35265 [Paraburkholderia sp. UCT31]|uniref:hypothetical protein n=1 Tax=Paraburkholderia sp. UCT31 TaxID=2615209 RepID=UPI001654E67E|nr:hypothetical protein [Paraburkholderia sp. UCT31]MBC8741810.1 hypothetical protein [Paraburkholderia sp. UCT31]